jgi:hypothetical protein
VRDNKSAQPSKALSKKERKTYQTLPSSSPRERIVETTTHRSIDRSIVARRATIKRGDLLDAIKSLRRALSFFCKVMFFVTFLNRRRFFFFFFVVENARETHKVDK